MAIAVSCPSCEHGLKVKDELAGKRIRCPKCQQPVAIPAAAETRVTAETPRKAVPRREESEDDRPRKKRKKKKPGGKGLWIGLGIGGGVVVIGIIVLVIVLAMRNRVSPDKGPLLVNQPPPVKEIVGRDEDKSNLKDLGVGYRVYCVEHRKGPENLKELTAYFKNSPPFIKMLTDGKFTCVFGVVPDQLEHDNQVLAYETVADAQGLRFVILGNTRVVTMDEAQFQRTPKISAALVQAPDPTRLPKAKVGGIPRFKDKLEAQHVLRGIGMAYKTYEETNSRPPLKLEDLEPFYEKNAKITNAVKAGTLKIVWGQKTAGGAQALIAFETDSDVNLHRMIVTGGGNPEEATEFRFQELLKDVPK